MHPAVRIALLVCPREFRDEHHGRIAADAGRRGSRWTPFATAADLFAAGARMRAEYVAGDVVFALRSLAKVPLFAAVAVLTIAVAVATNVAVSAVVAGVVLQPLPYPDAARLVFAGAGPTVFSRLSAYDARSIAASPTLSSIALSRETSQTYAAAGTVPVALRGHIVSGNYLSLLGATAQLGRLLSEADAGTARTVISASTWQRYFGGDPGIVGKTVRLSGQSYIVVGVLAPGFLDPAPYGLTESAFWTPVDPRSPMMFSRVWRAFIAIGKLAPGIRPESAGADASRIIARIARTDPPNYVGVHGVAVRTMYDQIVGPVLTLIWTLYVAVTGVLLVACANVASLYVTRTARRSRELAARNALGATHSRLAAQLTTEAALVAAAGGGLGLIAASGVVAAFRGIAASRIPRWDSVHVDARVVTYTLAVAALCAVAAAVLPALLHRRIAGLEAGSTRSSAGRAAHRLGAALVVTEIALAIVLVAGAGLLVRSYVARTHVPVGFDGRNAYVVDVRIPASLPPGDDALAAYAERLTRAVQALPGVTDAAVAGPVPFIPDTFLQSFSLPGSARRYNVNKHPVGPRYFAALRIPLVRGRAFDSRDGVHAPAVAIVNERFARTYFGTDDIEGRRLTFASFTNAPPVPARIVGVVADTRNSFGIAPEPEVYVPAVQAVNFWHVVLRTAGADAGLGAAVSGAVRQADPSAPPPPVHAYSELFARDAEQARAATVVLSALAFVALVLASSGVYAVTSYAVQARTREFGIRSAVGAQRFSILRGVLAAAAAQSALGIAFGIAGVAACVRLVSELLFGTSPFDAPTWAAVVLLLTGCTLAAALGPALRATRVDAARALRVE